MINMKLIWAIVKICFWVFCLTFVEGIVLMFKIFIFTYNLTINWMLSWINFYAYWLRIYIQSQSVVKLTFLCELIKDLYSVTIMITWITIKIWLDMFSLFPCDFLQVLQETNNKFFFAKKTINILLMLWKIK